MPPRTPPKVVLLQGTLDMLILRTLLFGAAHGHGISSFIQQTTQDALIVEHGSLYPALHRLERNGWIAGKWGTAPNRNREYKYYRLTPLGRKQLVAEQSKWEELVRAIGRVMQLVTEE
jgi:PadR family transcriptional regulator, regulatory protein PadR